MDYTKPTTQMLGRFQPWHEGHTKLFERALVKTGQVVILCRAEDKGEKNPYSFEDRVDMINKALVEYKDKYVVLLVPNITHITYGRDVGYTIEQEHLGADIESISATKLRASH